MWTWVRVDYELDWPAELLGSELHALLYYPRAYTARPINHSA